MNHSITLNTKMKFYQPLLQKEINRFRYHYPQLIDNLKTMQEENLKLKKEIEEKERVCTFLKKHIVDTEIALSQVGLRVETKAFREFRERKQKQFTEEVNKVGELFLDGYVPSDEEDYEPEVDNLRNSHHDRHIRLDLKATLTRHCRARMIQREISKSDVYEALIHPTNVETNIPGDCIRFYSKERDTMVIYCPQLCKVITTYRGSEKIHLPDRPHSTLTWKEFLKTEDGVNYMEKKKTIIEDKE